MTVLAKRHIENEASNMSARHIPKIEPSMHGFESINRYVDKSLGVITAKILPGEYYVTRNEEMITTVLGSCISVCIYEQKIGLGGMNHFMLPQAAGINNEADDLMSESFRYGDVAMERMINDLLRNGADKDQMWFKAFGGGQIIKQMTSVGERNIKFLHKFMVMEGFKLAASDLGGPHPRKVNFFPKTGKVMVKKLQHMHNDTIAIRETQYRSKIDKPKIESGSIDLFD